MARPRKGRRVCRMPLNREFYSNGREAAEHKILLTVDEYETIRLMDYCGYTQAECAKQMQVGRATVQTIYTEARKKVARFLVEGMPIQISGGDYELCMQDCLAGQSISQPSCQPRNGEGGNHRMKIAVTHENGQVFQHFGHTKEFKVYEVEDGKIVSSEIVDTNGQGHGALAGLLADEDIKVLICGGIGGGARNALAQAGIELYPGAVGDADEQVASFIQGKLVYDPNTMCNHHSHAEGEACGEHGHHKGGCGHSCH